MSSKVHTKYICSNCGAETLKWMGRCPQCGEWNTLEERVETMAPKSLGPFCQSAEQCQTTEAFSHSFQRRQTHSSTYE